MRGSTSVSCTKQQLTRLQSTDGRPLQTRQMLTKLTIRNYHVLARHVGVAQIDSEVREVLDAVQNIASRATPTGGS